MDMGFRQILVIAVATLLIVLLAAPALADTTVPDGATYRVIEDRQDALGVHPALLENPNAHDPTYDEMAAFLATDDTATKKYDMPNFTCADFAAELQNNAESQGLNCGYASMEFYGKEGGHAVDVFDTVDRGPVYVDATAGKALVSESLKPGEPYYNHGIISKITEYW